MIHRLRCWLRSRRAVGRLRTGRAFWLSCFWCKKCGDYRTMEVA